MENENGIPTKPFYKRKALVIPLVALMSIGLIFALVPYFHQTQVDLTVNEARSSADLPASFSFVSGETQDLNRTIHNAANVDLCAELSWSEVNNTGVTYTTNLPKTVTLLASSETIVTVSFTADQTTEIGSVSGNIQYSKIACP